MIEIKPKKSIHMKKPEGNAFIQWGLFFCRPPASPPLSLAPVDVFHFVGFDARAFFGAEFPRPDVIVFGGW